MKDFKMLTMTNVVFFWTVIFSSQLGAAPDFEKSKACRYLVAISFKEEDISRIIETRQSQVLSRETKEERIATIFAQVLDVDAPLSRYLAADLFNPAYLDMSVRDLLPRITAQTLQAKSENLYLDLWDHTIAGLRDNMRRGGKWHGWYPHLEVLRNDYFLEIKRLSNEEYKFLATKIEKLVFSNDQLSDFDYFSRSIRDVVFEFLDKRNDTPPIVESRRLTPLQLKKLESIRRSPQSRLTKDLVNRVKSVIGNAFGVISFFDAEFISRRLLEQRDSDQSLETLLDLIVFRN